jgi:hypothetical protein
MQWSRLRDVTEAGRLSIIAAVRETFPPVKSTVVKTGNSRKLDGVRNTFPGYVS